MLYCIMHHMKAYMNFDPTKPARVFSPKFKNYWTDVHLHIVKLESGDQQPPVLKENLSRNGFDLEKSSFIKSNKPYVFTEITDNGMTYQNILKSSQTKAWKCKTPLRSFRLVTKHHTCNTQRYDTHMECCDRATRGHR